MARDPAGVPLHLHMDYAGPFRGKLWLVVMDAYSKWPEIHAMSTTTAQATIHQLRKVFSAHSLLEQLITDNGPQFVAEDFKHFCQTRGIQHTLMAPYHRSSNGEAEWLVEIFKLGINKADPKTATELDHSVIEFLNKYQATPHSVTNTSPSEMLNNRHLRTTLNLLHPCQVSSSKLRA